jgi:hypothetical protein
MKPEPPVTNTTLIRFLPARSYWHAMRSPLETKQRPQKRKGRPQAASP